MQYTYQLIISAYFSDQVGCKHLGCPENHHQVGIAVAYWQEGFADVQVIITSDVKVRTMVTQAEHLGYQHVPTLCHWHLSSIQKNQRSTLGYTERVSWCDVKRSSGQASFFPGITALGTQDVPSMLRGTLQPWWSYAIVVEHGLCSTFSHLLVSTRNWRWTVTTLNLLNVVHVPPL